MKGERGNRCPKSNHCFLGWISSIHYGETSLPTTSASDLGSGKEPPASFHKDTYKGQGTNFRGLTCLMQSKEFKSPKASQCYLLNSSHLNLLHFSQENLNPGPICFNCNQPIFIFSLPFRSLNF